MPEEVQVAEGLDLYLLRQVVMQLLSELEVLAG
jgi:hypothetical protein